MYRSSYNLTLYYITKGGWKNSLPALSRGVCGVPPVLLLLLLPAIYATLLKDNEDQDNPLLRICTSLPFPSYPNSLSSHFHFFLCILPPPFVFYLCLFVPCPTWCFAVSVIFVSFQFTVYPYRCLSSHPVRAMSRNVAPRHHVIKISRFCLNLSKHWLPNFLKGYVFASSFSRYLADAVIQNDLLCTNDKFCWSNLMFCSLVQWR